MPCPAHNQRLSTDLVNSAAEGHVSNHEMKKIIKVSVIISVICLVVYFVIMLLIYQPRIPHEAELLPTEIIATKQHPSSHLMAQILEGRKLDGFNPLGSSARYYLALQYPEIKHLILYDLSEGSGSYEGGVLDIKWINSNRVLIERIVNDRQANIVFDVSQNRFEEVASK